MKLKALVEHSAQLIKIISKSRQPSDKIASEYFRSKKYIGSKERKFVSEIVFASLRNLILLKHLSALSTKNIKIKEQISESMLISILIVLSSEFDDFADIFSVEEIYNKININNSNIKAELSITLLEYYFATIEDVNNWINSICILYKELTDLPHNSLKKIETLYSFPMILTNELINLDASSKALDVIEKNASCFRTSANVCLRVNTAFADRSSICKELDNYNIPFELGTVSPDAIILKKRAQISELPCYKSGAAEIQDEGSQLIAYALAPKQGKTVLDACAGAGGKSLHIAMLQKDTGMIISTDTEYMRLKEIAKRAHRAAVKSINPMMISENGRIKTDSPALKHFKESNFDYVLVDAPCSGMGTLRRDPMKKYRTDICLINKIAVKQKSILEFYSRYVKPGGILVYATCSIMPHENEMVVNNFLENNPDFIPDSLYDAFIENDIHIEGLEINDFKITLQPGVHKTDGFFMARLKRQS